MCLKAEPRQTGGAVSQAEQEVEKVEEDVRDVSWACIGLVAACAFRLGIFDVLRWDERQRSLPWGERKLIKMLFAVAFFLALAGFPFLCLLYIRKG